MVNIYEVGPRDGFQNVEEYIPVETKKKIIDMLVDSGIKKMQVTSFVSPKAIPQLKDAKEIAEYATSKYPDVFFSALVPNLYGAKAAKEAGIKNLSYVVSLSVSHNKANINRTHEESFNELKKILDEVDGVNVSVDVATTFGCPFEGKYTTEHIMEFLQKIYDFGIREMTLADTIGVANPKQVREIVTAAIERFPDVNFVVHIHDTRNMGIVNSLAAVECGIKDVQSTLGGLGGCPFAPGASGNTATEDFVYMLNDMGIETGVSFEKILEAAKYEKEVIVGNFSSHQVNIKTPSVCTG